MADFLFLSEYTFKNIISWSNSISFRTVDFAFKSYSVADKKIEEEYPVAYLPQIFTFDAD
jgi:hypothetical protein